MGFWDAEDLDHLKKCFIIVTDAPDDGNVALFMALLDRPRPMEGQGRPRMADIKALIARE